MPCTAFRYSKWIRIIITTRSLSPISTTDLNDIPATLAYLPYTFASLPRFIASVVRLHSRLREDKRPRPRGIIPPFEFRDRKKRGIGCVIAMKISCIQGDADGATAAPLQFFTLTNGPETRLRSSLFCNEERR